MAAVLTAQRRAAELGAALERRGAEVGAQDPRPQHGDQRGRDRQHPVPEFQDKVLTGQQVGDVGEQALVKAGAQWVQGSQ